MKIQGSLVVYVVIRGDQEMVHVSVGRSWVNGTRVLWCVLSPLHVFI